jgi:hypothetical protein
MPYIITFPQAFTTVDLSSFITFICLPGSLINARVTSFRSIAVLMRSFVCKLAATDSDRGLVTLQSC